MGPRRSELGTGLQRYADLGGDGVEADGRTLPSLRTSQTRCSVSLRTTRRPAPEAGGSAASSWREPVAEPVVVVSSGALGPAGIIRP